MISLKNKALYPDFTSLYLLYCFAPLILYLHNINPKTNEIFHTHYRRTPD